MIPDRLRTLLVAANISQRGLAAMLCCHERVVRRWATGEVAVPPMIAEWLERSLPLQAAVYEDIKANVRNTPPPPGWKHRE